MVSNFMKISGAVMLGIGGLYAYVKYREYETARREAEAEELAEQERRRALAEAIVQGGRFWTPPKEKTMEEQVAQFVRLMAKDRRYVKAYFTEPRALLRPGAALRLQ